MYYAIIALWYIFFTIGSPTFLDDHECVINVMIGYFLIFIAYRFRLGFCHKSVNFKSRTVQFLFKILCVSYLKGN